MSPEDDLNELINIYIRRLRELKKQEALAGAFADPRIPIEIQDIEAKIQQLQAKSGAKIEEPRNARNSPAAGPGQETGQRSSSVNITGPATIVGDVAGNNIYKAGGNMENVGNTKNEETNVDKSISIGGDNYGFAGIDSLFENVTNTINTAPKMDLSAKAELTKLMDELKAELAKVPQARAADAANVAKRAQQAVEAATDTDPDATIVEKSGERLKQAAENIKNVAPTVINIATMIATAIRKFVIGV